MKKLSVITINYNNRDGLLRTIKSVAGQTCRDFEYIVIDGGSNDGSVDVIKEYADYIDYWVSEPDKGIYNAMNKGVQAAHGEFCQFLNSGDWYDSNIVVEAVLPCLSDEVDILSGNGYRVCENGNLSKMESPGVLTCAFFINNSLPHQSAFIRTNCLDKRPYDENYKIVSDWKFFLESYLYDKIRYRKLNMDVSLYEGEGISDVNQDGNINERTSVWQQIDTIAMLSELGRIPYQMYGLYQELDTSYQFKRWLTWLNKGVIKLYYKFSNKLSNEYGQNEGIYPPQLC